MTSPRTDPNTLASLRERIEKASGGDRELDFDIEAALAPKDQAAHWQGMRVRVFAGIPADEYSEFDEANNYNRFHRKKGSKDENPAPAYTASIDAALSLVEKMLPDACYTQSKRYRTTRGRISGFVYLADVSGSDVCEAATLALALLSALLSALSALEPNRGGR